MPARPGRSPVVSRSTTTYVASSRTSDEVAVPGETHVGVDHVRQQRAGQGDRCAAEREEMLRRLLGRDRPATLLHEFHEPVGRI
jgi:hypothetical protein